MSGHSSRDVSSEERNDAALVIQHAYRSLKRKKRCIAERTCLLYGGGKRKHHCFLPLWLAAQQCAPHVRALPKVYEPIVERSHTQLYSRENVYSGLAVQCEFANGALEVDKQGMRVAIAAPFQSNGSLQVLDLRNLAIGFGSASAHIASKRLRKEFTSIRWDPCNDFILAAAGKGSEVTLINVGRFHEQADQRLRLVDGYAAPSVEDIRYHPIAGGSCLAAADDEGRVTIFDCRKKRAAVARAFVPRSGREVLSSHLRLTGVEWCGPCGCTLLACGKNGSIHAWDARKVARVPVLFENMQSAPHLRTFDIRYSISRTPALDGYISQLHDLSQFSIQSISRSPAVSNTVACCFGNGWSAVLDLEQNVVTHAYCPPEKPTLIPSSLAKPRGAWNSDGTEFVAPVNDGKRIPQERNFANGVASPEDPHNAETVQGVRSHYVTRVDCSHSVHARNWTATLRTLEKEAEVVKHGQPSTNISRTPVAVASCPKREDMFIVSTTDAGVSLLSR